MGCEHEGQTESRQEIWDALAVDESDEPIVCIKVQADDRAYLHDFVTWSDEVGDQRKSGTLTVYDARVGLPIAVYPPGAWLCLEVLRFYHKGDDPPEAEI